jgi:hypothetical protein
MNIAMPIPTSTTAAAAITQACIALLSYSVFFFA